MKASENDMSALREAQQQISSRISRFALVRLIVLVVLVFTFSHSFEELEQNPELIKQLKQYPIGGSTWSSREYVDDTESRLEISEDANSPSPIPSLEPSSTPLVKPSPTGSLIPSPTPSAKPSPAPSVRPSPTPDQTTVAELSRLNSNMNPSVPEKAKVEEAQQKKERDESRDSLKKIFTLDLSIQGFRIVLDLRIWVYFLPFLFLISEVYLQIQREKRKLLSAVAASNVATASLEANESTSSGTSTDAKRVRPTSLDMLVFSKNAYDKTPFSQHPSQFEEILYTSGVVIAVVYMLLLGTSFWSLWERKFQIMYLQILMTFICWGIAYYRYVSKALEKQVLEVTGLQVAPGWAARIWKFGNQKVQTLRAIVKKRINVSLITGSLLVLATLFLSTATSCDHQPKQGYQLAMGQKDAMWFSVVNLSPTNSNPFAPGQNEYVKTLQFMGRAAYITGLIVALISLLLLLLRSRHRHRVSFWLFVLSGTVVLFVITDSSFALAAYNEVLFLIKTGCFFVALCLWYGLGLPNTQSSKSKWQKARRVLVAFYVPLVVNAGITILFAVRYDRLWGLLWFFVGSAVICLSHMELKKAAQEDSVGSGAAPVRQTPVEALTNTS